MEFRVTAVAFDECIKQRLGVVEDMDIGGRKAEVDTGELRFNCVSATFGSVEANETVLTDVAGFHRNFAGADGPAFRSDLGLPSRVEGHVGIITGTGSVAFGGMP